MRPGSVWSWGFPEYGLDDPSHQYWVDGGLYDLTAYHYGHQWFIFSQPYYYTYWYFGIYLGSRTRPLYVTARYYLTGYVGQREWPTAEEVEAAALADEAGGSFYPAWYGIPLGIVILRNNGVVGQRNQFLPVEMSNRGNSYFLMCRSNMAPRFYA